MCVCVVRVCVCMSLSSFNLISLAHTLRRGSRNKKKNAKKIDLEDGEYSRPHLCSNVVVCQVACLGCHTASMHTDISGALSLFLKISLGPLSLLYTPAHDLCHHTSCPNLTIVPPLHPSTFTVYEHQEDVRLQERTGYVSPLRCMPRCKWLAHVCTHLFACVCVCVCMCTFLTNHVWHLTMLCSFSLSFCL